MPKPVFRAVAKQEPSKGFDLQETLRNPLFTQLHAEDFFMRHCYLYYVKNEPILSDAVFDAMHKAFLDRYPTSEILNRVGSDNENDYPLYIVRGVRPTTWQRKIDRDLTFKKPEPVVEPVRRLVIVKPKPKWSVPVQVDLFTSSKPTANLRE